MAAVHITKDGVFFRVRVLPPDAAPSGPLAPETHAGVISARVAADRIAAALGLPVVDQTRGGAA
jgi:hypothetical protein